MHLVVALILAVMPTSLPRVAEIQCPNLQHGALVQTDGYRSCKMLESDFRWVFDFGVEEKLWDEKQTWDNYEIQFVEGVWQPMHGSKSPDKVLQLPFLCGDLSAIGCTKNATHQVAIVSSFDNDYQMREVFVHELIHAAHPEDFGHCGWAEKYESAWRHLSFLAPYVEVYDDCNKKECLFVNGEKFCHPIP